MKLVLCGSTALQFWRSCDVSSKRLAARIDMPQTFIPSLSKSEYQYLASRFGFKKEVVNLVGGQTSRRNSRLMKCVVDYSSLSSEIIHLGKQLYVESPEYTVFRLAAGLASTISEKRKTDAAIILATIICELAGTYRLAPDTSDGFRKSRALTTVEDISKRIDQLPRTSGKSVVAKAVSCALDNSNSPAETQIALFETFPKTWGGMGMAKPELNKRITTPNSRKKARVADQCWETSMRIVEYNGGYHEGERANDDDARRNALITCGYTVNVVNKNELHDAMLLDTVLSDVAAKVGTEGRRPTDYDARRAHMRKLVLETCGTQCRENDGVLVPAQVKANPYTLSRL